MPSLPTALPTRSTLPLDEPAASRAAALEAPLATVEQRLADLGHALTRRDAAEAERAAAALHAALATAVDHFGRAARSGGVPPPLRQRLVRAGGQVAAQREALARASASLDRAIDVLLPRAAASAHGVYSAGPSARGGTSLS